MAKQIGEYRFEGTVDGICFYKMEGEYYARRQSSLTGKRFWKAACFERSRKSCERLSLGSQLAARVYKSFEKQEGMYAALKSKAIALLKKNTSEEKVLKKLLKLAFLLQPLRKHSFKPIYSLAVKNQKENTLTSLFRIAAVHQIGYRRNVYLSSA